jgi:hypothetical protein
MKPIKPLNRFWNRSPVFYRIRNRLLFKKVKPSELEELNYNKYNPKDSIPEIYFEINEKIFPTKNTEIADFDKAIHIATWLRKNINGGKGLGVSSDLALKYMLSGGYGICSDFCQIFNNFCVINNIMVREWGLQNVVNEYEGHSFNEFYASEQDQWVLIDVAYGIYFKSKDEKNKPLSVTEVFRHSKLNLEKKMLLYTKDFKLHSEILGKYYFSKYMYPFLVDNYHNKFYDNLLNRFNFLPIPFIHGIAILLGKSYNYKKIKL